MFELVIKRPDNTTYWDATFNTLDEANKWLSEEQTRVYWDPAFVSTITDLAPSKAVQDQQALDLKTFQDAQTKMAGDLNTILKAGVSASNINQAVTILIKKLIGG